MYTTVYLIKPYNLVVVQNVRATSGLMFNQSNSIIWNFTQQPI